VRRLLAWGAGLAGVAAAWKLVSRGAPVAAADPAEELRAKLAESRELVDEQEEFGAGETPVDADERRRSVHEHARETLNEMRRRPGS
jgi:NADPH-dependent 2,4-dienoyl-CoA reductase/sulfur reductase-like enzyme